MKLALFSAGLIAFGQARSGLRGTTNDEPIDCPPAHTADYDGFPYQAGEGAVYHGFLWICNENTATAPSDNNPAWSKITQCEGGDSAPPTPSDGVDCPPAHTADYDGSPYKAGEGAVYKDTLWICVKDTNTPPSDDNPAWSKLRSCPGQDPSPPAPPTPSGGEELVVCPPAAMAGYEVGTTYSKGDRVVYQNYSWQAVQETRTPPSASNPAWSKVGKCKDEATPTTSSATTHMPTTAAPVTTARRTVAPTTVGPHPAAPTTPHPTAAPPVPSGGTVACPAEAAWSGRVYMKDEMAVYSNILWKANWYAQNPPSELDLAWTKMGKCDTPEVDPPCASEVWTAKKVYSTPTDVSYQGGNYRNKWYDGGIVPPSPGDANWVYFGPCSGGTA